MLDLSATVLALLIFGGLIALAVPRRSGRELTRSLQPARSRDRADLPPRPQP
jgi:hypothetical protein